VRAFVLEMGNDGYYAGHDRNGNPRAQAALKREQS
jgi:hypothetical protein